MVEFHNLERTSLKLNEKVKSSLLLILINILVLCSLISLSEFALRICTFAQTCSRSSCDWSVISKIKIHELELQRSQNLGLTTLDKNLGWVLTPGFSGNVKNQNGHQTSVNVEANGFRSNGAGLERSHEMNDAENALVVGDSYAFGAEVSDWETWPSCLERELKIPVYNAGVAGYGAAQAVRRAMLLTEKKHYSQLIWAILVGHDFDRDRKNYKSGFPKPSVIADAEAIKWSDVSDPMHKGTKFRPDTPGFLASWIYENSIIGKSFIDAVFHWDMTGTNLDSVHPQAATKDDIIKFAFENFLRTSPLQKTIVLQYKTFAWIDREAMEERRKIWDIANEHNIKVVDTFADVSRYQPDAIWNGHHTPLGNKVVCERILSFYDARGRSFRRVEE